MSMKRHKRIRLEAPIYATEGQVVSVTVAVKGREPVFTKREIAEGAVYVIQELSAATGVQVLAYCILPDHVHLVISPSPECDVITFVGRFKSLVTRSSWAQGISGTFWQRSFWDRIVRKDEDLRTVIEYVLGNSVRAGLVQDWRSYPYGGSLVYEL
jgi:putative transposase